MLEDTIHIGDIQIRDLAKVQRLSELKHFPRDENWRWCRHVMTPGHLMARQDELEAGIDNLAKYDPRPCICSVFGLGEDLGDRASTRIGGLPFWPKDKPWPTAQDGSAKEFIGQWDFRNIQWSERLPGDVLTFHFDFDWDGEGRFDGPADGAAATLVWHDSKTTTDLIDREDIPPTNSLDPPIGPYYGREVLVTDYKVINKASSGGFEDTEECKFWLSLTIHGMKIGGHSPLYGTNWQETFSVLREPVFLCSMAAISPPRKPAELAAWLPRKPGFDAKNKLKGCEVKFLDMGVFVVAYERGNPHQLHWETYMP